MENLREGRLSTVQHRGGTQIPEEVRRTMKLKEGDRLYWEPVGEQYSQVFKVKVEVKKA